MPKKKPKKKTAAKAKKVSAQSVKFTYNCSQAKKVTLAGSFNNWNDTKTPMAKGRGKVWQRSLSLKPGKYEYKFVVDGNWINDPDNNQTVWNSFGSTNSIIEI